MSELMSEYERKAWDQLQRQTANLAVKGVAVRGGSFVSRLPGVGILEGGLSGVLRRVVMDPAMRTVSTDAVLKRYGVASLEQVRGLDLSQCDEAVARLGLRSSVIAATHGAAAAAAPVNPAAISADLVALLAGMGRLVGEMGAYYGYDIADERERVFALAVIAYSAAAPGPEKDAALRDLFELSRKPSLKFMRFVYARLGLRLVKAGLFKFIPGLGILIGVKFNASLLSGVARDAQFAYRARFLMEKYAVAAPVPV